MMPERGGTPTAAPAVPYALRVATREPPPAEDDPGPAARVERAPTAVYAAIRRHLGGDIPHPAEAAHWSADDVAALQETLSDQAAAIDSLERRAMMLMSPTAFVLALGINNAAHVGGSAVAGSLYYGGLTTLIVAIALGGVALWPRRPLSDPTLSPPRHRDADPAVVVPLMAESAAHNFRGYHLKTLSLRFHLVGLVAGSCAIVAALAYLR